MYVNVGPAYMLTHTYTHMLLDRHPNNIPKVEFIFAVLSFFVVVIFDRVWTM